MLHTWFFVVLCNPTNGSTQTFPVPKSNRRDIYARLGYDPVKDEYKLLCVRMFHGWDGDRRQDHLVHSLNFKFRWRKIQTNADPYAYLEGGICMDGAIYYGVGHTRIARFDVGSEDIAFIQGPEDYNAISCYSTLTNYQGKLACISYGESHEMRMWILQDAEKQEWSNAMTCSVPCDKKTSLCTGEIHTNEVVMASRWLESSKPFYVYYFDMMRESIRRVQIDGMADNEFRRIHGIGKNALRISCYPGHVEHFVGAPIWYYKSS
ncbi:PREDICTED: F-box protein At1g30790-like [Camelina sativa]|uniref:F-box protein At1g30790-like n=1 Tax=Camelina sativa TaxID=90675 RepID=A0ABM1QLN4_CAMSA|nr:PREDICTED: F-box protein At1g30790-like [Camelina sativa]